MLNSTGTRERTPKWRFATRIRLTLVIILFTLYLNESYNDQNHESLNLLRKESIAKDFEKKQKAINGIKLLYDGKPLDREYTKSMLMEGKKRLSAYDTIHSVSLPKINDDEHSESSKKGITIVGDIHGSLFNMVKIFKSNGFPSLSNPYIFNGDFTDKGEQSVECFLSLLLIKTVYCNECIHINRGNHELSLSYNRQLKTEVLELYDEEIWALFKSVIKALPLGVVVDDRILVIHGGLPRDDFNLEAMKNYQRQDLKDSNEDLTLDDVGEQFKESLWANFKDENGINENDYGWTDVGPDITEKFFNLNNLEYIVRGHIYFPEGYHKHHDGQVITIHSDPHEESDFGAYMNIYSNDGSMHISQFYRDTEKLFNWLDWRRLLNGEVRV